MPDQQGHKLAFADSMPGAPQRPLYADQRPAQDITNIHAISSHSEDHARSCLAMQMGRESEKLQLDRISPQHRMDSSQTSRQIQQPSKSLSAETCLQAHTASELSSSLQEEVQNGGQPIIQNGKMQHINKD